MRLDSMEEEVLPGGLRLSAARSHWQRGLGLMGLGELPPGRALRIPRCSSVHTFWMRFPIDLVWLDGDGRVLRVDAAVKRRIKACRGAREVVETRAGEGDAYAAALSRSGSSSAGG